MAKISGSCEVKGSSRRQMDAYWCVRAYIGVHTRNVIMAVAQYAKKFQPVPSLE